MRKITLLQYIIICLLQTKPLCCALSSENVYCFVAKDERTPLQTIIEASQSNFSFIQIEKLQYYRETKKNHQLKYHSIFTKQLFKNIFISTWIFCSHTEIVNDCNSFCCTLLTLGISIIFAQIQTNINIIQTE